MIITNFPEASGVENEDEEKLFCKKKGVEVQEETRESPKHRIFGKIVSPTILQNKNN